MDFLDPIKKKAHKKRLFIGYFLVGIAILIGSLILLFQSYGYDLDRKTGSVYQNGLIFLDSHPESATIWVNGKEQGQTGARLALPAGQYTVELSRDGYHTWQRTLNLEGGSIERMVYPMLVPRELTISDVHLYGTAPVFATQSPDRKWLMIQQTQVFGGFDLFDTGQQDPNPTTLQVPVGTVISESQGPSSLSLVEWSTNNRHVLLKHTYSGGTEFIIVDREDPAGSVNVNKRLGISPSSVTLRDKKHDLLYVYDEAAKTLQTADLRNNQIASFLTNVLAYKSHGAETVLFVTDDGSTPGEVQLKLRDNDGVFLIRNLPPAPPYLLEIAQYSGNWYVVAGAQSGGRVFIYKNPQQSIKSSAPKVAVPITTLRTDKGQYAAFSQNTQFIMVQNGAEFAVYDIEYDRRYYYELDIPIDGNANANWMDGHRINVTSGGKVVVFDFDGINRQTLSANTPGFLPAYDRDYTALYNVAPSVAVTGRAALTRTELKVNR